MDARNAYLKEHRFTWALTCSVLLHVILIFLYTRHGERMLFTLPETEEEQSTRIAFEIVETPDVEEERTPEAQTNLLSDKRMSARDMATNPISEGDLPYHQGRMEEKTVPRFENPADRYASQQRTGAERPAERSYENDRSSRYGRNRASEFSPEALLGQRRVRVPSGPERDYQQESASVDDVGTIRFNTYDWEFAPYLLELKHRIERNIYPPPVFTYLGFGGKNKLRFIIHPDGRYDGPEVLGYEGEKALVETSVKAIQMSGPFMPLPEDFPEPVLEVTASFVYYGRR